MNLLGAILYDPGTAVTKATSSLLAMTALDTTNLRLTVTVPSHGKLYVRMKCVLHGSLTTAQVLLGVLNGSTVVARCAPSLTAATIAATSLVNVDVSFVVPGLTPGSITLDAAYGVEVAVASTGLKYGGPDNTTTNDAFGAFVFEIWDPQPQQTNGQLVVDSNGRVDVSKIAGTSQTARDIGASVLLSAGTGTGQLDFTSGVVKANTTQFGGSAITQTAGIPHVDTRYVGGTTQTAADLASAVTNSQEVLNRLSTTRAGYLDNLSAGAVATAASISALNNLSTAQVNAEVDTALADAGLAAIRTGTAQTGGAGSITLDSGASASDDFYKWCLIKITGGTGANQYRVIIGYVGSTKVASVYPNWVTTPNNTSTFAILADGLTGSIGDNGIIAASFASGAITATTIAANAIGASELASDAVTEIQSGLATAAAVAALNNLSAAQVNAEVDAALADVGLTTTVTGRIDVAVSSRGTGTALDAAGVRSAIGLASANLDTQFDTLPTASEVRTQCDDALMAIHLDHLLATTYDPASKPGAADALLNELIESDAGVSRYTANALEQAPTGGGGGTTDWTSDERTAIRSVLGIPASGTTPDDPTTGILDTIRDKIDVVDDLLDTEIGAIKAKTDNLPASPAATGDIPSAATVAGAVRTELTTELGRIDAAVSTRSTITTGQVNTEVDTALADAGVNTTTMGRLDVAVSTRGTGTALDAAGVRSAVGLASANLDTQLDALPTAAENATAVASQVTTDHGSGSYVRNTEPPSAASNASAVRTELTTELGRIDVAISSRGTGTALDAAGVRSAVGLASADLDTQLGALPTAVENATAILAAGDVDGYTVEQTLKLCLAALAGKLSGAATTTIVIRAADDSKTRITATVDADGNRSSITYDAAG